MEIVLVILGLVIAGVLGAILWLLLRPKNELLGQRLESLEKHVEYSRQASERGTTSVMSQVQSFTRGMTELQEAVKNVQEKVRDVASFQDIFKSPKLRGNWGEYSLENALSQYFPRAAWELQHPFST